MRLLTVYTCPPRKDVGAEIARAIELHVHKDGDRPAEMFYRPVTDRLRPAIVSAHELMCAQVQALRILEAEAQQDPAAAELLERGQRLVTRIVEGRITSTAVAGMTFYDVEDPDGTTLGDTLRGMLRRGSSMARAQIDDPDDTQEVPRHAG